MLQLVDSHCHLDMLDVSPYGEAGLDGVIADAKAASVNHMLCVAVDDTQHATLQAIAEAYPEVYFSVGLHPNEAPERCIDIDAMTQQAQHPKLVAIGETGLDYFRSEGDLSWQKDRFVDHLTVARATKKPVIIHTRQAKADTLAIMQAEDISTIGGVLHCFTEDWAMAKQALDLGLYISFSGIVTFKNATEIQSVVKKMPLDRLLIETDAPYLTPVPYRGKPNYPAYVRYVADHIASLRQCSLETLSAATTKNFFDLFQIKR